MIPISRPIIGKDERAAVHRVLRSGHLAAGPEVEAFEEEFSRYVGADYAVAVGSGTAALIVGLLAAGVTAGDEVIIPSFTFAATANAVRFCGADPVFAEVDTHTYCISAKTVEPLLSRRTVAILPVHLYGHPAQMGELRELASQSGLALFEDAAQAHGATWNGQGVGSFGAFAAFSFYPTKNMTTGEGGMITTSDADLARAARLLRNQGMEHRYQHVLVGLNERMTEIEAAIGRVQLRKLPSWTKGRQANALYYNKLLRDNAVIPMVDPRASHVYHQYTIRVPCRDRVVAAMRKARIGYGIYYPIPVHKQPPFSDVFRELPITDELAASVLSIPIRPDLTRKERAQIADTVLSSFSR